MLRTEDRFRRSPILNPPHHRHQHVGIRTQTCIAPALSNLPSARSTGAVPHARYAEVAVELVEGRRGEIYGPRDMVVVPFRVVGADKSVLQAVVRQQLAAAISERAQIAFPRLDVEGVQAGGVGIIRNVYCGGVPVRIVVYSVAEPVGCIGKGRPVVY